MKIVFIVRDPVPTYSIMSLSAYLKREGHTCEIIFAHARQNLVNDVREREAQVVAFSCTSGRHLWAMKVGRILKQHLNVVTVIGGPHATFFPDIINDAAFDVVCVGEGEEAILELMNNLEKKKPIKNIANLWVKEGDQIHRNPIRPLIQDLNALPAPDREIYMDVPYIREYQRDTFIFMTGRGCPYNCSYCYNKAAKTLYRGKGRFVRRMSPEKAIAELKEANTRYRLNGIIFEDDTFTINLDWLREFLPLYRKEVNVPFICNARGDNMSSEMAGMLAMAGCRGVKIGVEAGNEEIRINILKKNVSNEQLIQAAQHLQKEGIEIQCFNIVGIPGGDLDKDFETLSFNAKLKANHTWCSIMNPYPQTEIREIALAKGLLDVNQTTEDFFCESYFIDTALNLPDKRKVVNLHHFFGFVARFPFMLPIVKLIIDLPLTNLYEFIFKLDHINSLRRFYHIRAFTWLRFLWHCRGIY
ncbi:MAG: radical SAM protein [Proteobacteria bacterium]|nr:radical SAM protein [Pseudomonadota bacterium]